MHLCNAGLDAAKRRKRKAGRKAMSACDYDHAVSVTEDMLVNLVFDVRGWAATAGTPRNEPDAPPTWKKAKRRSGEAPDQLGLSLTGAGLSPTYTRTTRRLFVEPARPNGMPQMTTMRSPILANPSSSACLRAVATISS